MISLFLASIPYIILTHARTITNKENLNACRLSGHLKKPEKYFFSNDDKFTL